MAGSSETKYSLVGKLRLSLVVGFMSSYPGIALVTIFLVEKIHLKCIVLYFIPFSIITKYLSSRRWRMNKNSNRVVKVKKSASTLPFAVQRNYFYGVKKCSWYTPHLWYCVQNQDTIVINRTTRISFNGENYVKRL